MDGLRQGGREVRVRFAAPDHEIELAPVPRPLRRARRRDPVQQVEAGVGDGGGGLDLPAAVAVQDDRGDEANAAAEAADRHAEGGGQAVLAVLLGEVQLPRDQLLALDDEEGPLRRADHHVPRGHLVLAARRGPAREARVPVRGGADEARAEGHEEQREEADPVGDVHGVEEEHDRQHAAEACDQVDGTPPLAPDLGGLVLGADVDGLDGELWGFKRGRVDEGGEVVEAGLLVAAFDADDGYVFFLGEPLHSFSAQEALRRGHQPREVAEAV